MTPAHLRTMTLLSALLPLLAATQARAADNYGIEIKIISAQPEGSGVHPSLQKYANDFKNMPFKKFELLDSQTKRLKKGETVTMQFPGPGKRFLKVRASGVKNDKLGFTLSIDAMKFKTTVRIPDRGTLIVGGPKYEKGVVLLAVTAHNDS